MSTREERIKAEQISKLKVSGFATDKALYDAITTLQIPLDTVPSKTYLTKATIIFMGKYDKAWEKIHFNDYT